MACPSSSSPRALTGIGLYTIAEAARYSRAKPAEIRRWLHGYSRRQRSYPPLWQPQVDYPSGIGFLDLLELRMVTEFVRHGVRLSVVRASIERARERFHDEFPLTTHRFLTDGRRIFLEALHTEGQAEPMLDMAAQQRVIETVIRPSLLAGIEFGESGRARRWFPVKGRKIVVLDPRISFGAPILAEYGIRTDTIAGSMKGEGSAARVAALFNIPQAAVKAAVAFEHRHAA